MSEKLSIQEAGKTRNFSGVGAIETETPEGESCFWVPESERELETEYVIKNGTYRPQKYGFSNIDVNVMDISTDIDGFDWEIEIPDIGLPEISLDLPDIGDIDLSIGIDGLPDIKIDGVSLDLPDISAYIDLDADIDVSLDVDSDGNVSLDLIGLDLNGDDIKVDIDLDDLSIDVESCPASIYILSRPASLVYTDGDTIDFTGLAVAALDKDGMDWPDPSTFTEIPFSELVLPTGLKAIYDEESSPIVVHTSQGDVTVSIAQAGDMVSKWTDPYTIVKSGSAQLYMWIPPHKPDYYAYTIIGENTAIVGRKHPDGHWSYEGYLGNNVIANQSIGWTWAANTIPPPAEITNGTWKNNIKESIQTVTVGWMSPCMQYFETSFDIFVVKGDTDSSSGGTTISGNYGGSHHSGKF